MNLYRERGVNPVSGCLPLLIQMPFLIGMFDLLKSSFALRGAPFIPGWIDDLTAPDVLFRWNYPIFFIGNEFHFLPILLGLSDVSSATILVYSSERSKSMTDQQRQQKAMGTMMTVVFAVMFYNFPSGLKYLLALFDVVRNLAAMVYNASSCRSRRPSKPVQSKTATSKKAKS